MVDTLYGWSQTASENGDIDDSMEWRENQAPSTVNDSARALMARIAQFLADLAPKRSSTGSGNAYAVTSDAAGTAHVDGEIVSFLPHARNTGACTLNVNGRGTKNWRPGVGLDFAPDNIIANVPVIATYRAASDEWISPGTGYYVSSAASGVALQSITARLPQIGDLVVSYAPTPGPGRIRLTEATQTLAKSAWPELNSYLSGIGYPWGSASTTFNLPPAAGYFLRFAATSSTVDTSGARTAGSTQADANKTATIPATGLTASTTTTTTTSTTTTITPNPHGHGSISAARSNLVIGTDGGGTLSATPDQTITIDSTELAASSVSESASSSTTTISGQVSLSGEAEVRVKNVAFHLDVVASTALSAAQVAVFGFPFQWDTGTSEADPGAGRVRGNNADLASITALYFSATDGWGVDLSDLIAGLGVGNPIHLSRVGGQANRIAASISGAPTDNGTYVTVPVTIDAASGAFSSNDQIAFEYGKGTEGEPGAPGATGGSAGLAYSWSTSLSGDPGSGKILANNSSLSSATAVHISKTGKFSEANGSYLLTWDDSTSDHKGHLRIYTLADRTEYIEADVTGVTDNTTYVTVALTNVSGAGIPTAMDEMSVVFLRAGDEGVVDGTSVAAAGAVMDGDFSTDGLMVRTAAGVYASRSLSEGTGITITNSNGDAGDPEIALSAGALASLALADSSVQPADLNDYVAVAGDTMTGLLTLSPGDATTNQDFLRLVPTDYGAGKPFFGVSKSATADRWDMYLWDGADNGGTIGIGAELFNVVGRQSITPPTPSADETDAIFKIVHYNQRPISAGVVSPDVGPIPGSVAKSAVLIDTVRTGGEGAYGNFLQFYKVTKAIAAYEFDVGISSHSSATNLNGGGIFGAWISASSPRAATGGHSISSEPSFAQGICALEVNAGNRWGTMPFQDYRASGQANFFTVGVASAPDVAPVNNESAPTYPDELFHGSFAFDITASVFGHKWWIGITMAPDTIVPGGVALNMHGGSEWGLQPTSLLRARATWDKGIDFNEAYFFDTPIRYGSGTDQVRYAANAGGTEAAPATVFCYMRVKIGASVNGLVPVYLEPA